MISENRVIVRNQKGKVIYRSSPLQMKEEIQLEWERADILIIRFPESGKSKRVNLPSPGWRTDEVRKTEARIMDRKWIKEIESGWYAPVYLFYGMETFLMEEAIKRLEDAVLGVGEDREWNHTVMDLEEIPVQDLVLEAETPSFFGRHRLVVGKNALVSHLCTGQERTRAPAGGAGPLRHPTPAKGMSLVLTVPAEKLDARKKVVKKLRKQVREVVFHPLDSKELPRWVAGKLKETGVEVHPKTGEVLIRQVGGDLRLLDMEIRKLATYAGPSGRITPETVTELVSRTLEQDVFKLVDRVARRRVAEGIALFYDLLQNREEPIRILALIIRQFRLMLQVKVLAAKGMSERGDRIHPQSSSLSGETCLATGQLLFGGSLAGMAVPGDRGGSGYQIRPDR